MTLTARPVRPAISGAPPCPVLLRRAERQFYFAGQATVQLVDNIVTH